MNFEDAKAKYIDAWGTLGTSWGINKAMAKIHALLLVSPRALSTEEIMDDLQISRGNANMNIRALLDWGLIYKTYRNGDRKEYFASEKDIWAVAKQVIRERRKRELEPVIKMLDQVSRIETGRSPDEREFKKVTKDLKKMANNSDKMLDAAIRAEENWFFSNIVKLFK